MSAGTRTPPDALPELTSYWNSSVIMTLKLIELGIGAGKLW